MAVISFQARSEVGTDLQRERILRISAKLFAEKGYQAVGVAEIGDSVGLGRGALYYHIGSKEQLLYDIIVEYITDLVTRGTTILREQSDARERIMLLSRHIMKVISANLAELTVCFRESDCLTGERNVSVSKLHANYQKIWTKAFEDGHRDGTFRRLPPVAIKGLLGMYFHSFLWLNPTGKNSAAQIGDVFADIVLRAAAPDDPRANSEANPRR